MRYENVDSSQDFSIYKILQIVLEEFKGIVWRGKNCLEGRRTEYERRRMSPVFCRFRNKGSHIRLVFCSLSIKIVVCVVHVVIMIVMIIIMLE